MGQVHSDSASVALGCVVGWGELRCESCSPHWCCSRQEVLQTAREREAMVTLCLWGRQQCLPQQQCLSSSAQPFCTGAVSPHHLPLLLWAHQVPEPGRGGETLVIWWCCGEGSKNCCWWSHSTMQQSPCSVLWVLCSTGVTSARWSLLTPESIHKGQWGHSHLLLRSQLWGWWPHSPWLHLGTSLELHQLPSFSDFSLKWWYIWENENCTFTTISMIIHLLLTVHTSWSSERCFFPVLVWIQYKLVPISMSGFLYQALISQRVFCSRFPLYFTQLDLFSRRLD